MAKFEGSNNPGDSAHHSPSLADQVGQILLGEVGFGPKAFYKESDQFLHDPTYLSHHPELNYMLGAVVSTPLQLGWKGVDDGYHLVDNTNKDWNQAGSDFQHAIINDPASAAFDGLKGRRRPVNG